VGLAGGRVCRGSPVNGRFALTIRPVTRTRFGLDRWFEFPIHATSALDYESERIIQDNMRLICHGRTVFIIAHRLTAVRHADRIVVLERGEIVEQGNHEQLLGRAGHYAALYRLQAA
jgi:ABC-type hemin transport system ATPase subunit